MQSRKTQPSEGGNSGTDSVRVDVEIWHDRKRRSLHRNSSSVHAGYAELNLMRLQKGHSMTSLSSTAGSASMQDGSRRRSNSSHPIKLIACARSATGSSCFLSDSFAQASTLESSAHWTAPIKVASLMGMSLSNLLLGRCEQTLKGTSWSFSRITSMLFGVARRVIRGARGTVAGFLNIATSWSRSWGERCTSGNPFTIETATARTTTRPISNFGSKPNRQAYAWRMWQRSMGLNWCPLDSASEISKHNFQHVLSKLIASLGVSWPGLTFKEAA